MDGAARHTEQWDPLELLELRDVEWSPPWGRPGGTMEHARAMLAEHLGDLYGIVLREVDSHHLFRRDPPEIEVRRVDELLGHIEIYPFDVLRFRGTRPDGVVMEGEVHGLMRFVPLRSLRQPDEDRD